MIGLKFWLTSLSSLRISSFTYLSVLSVINYNFHHYYLFQIKKISNQSYFLYNKIWKSFFFICEKLHILSVIYIYPRLDILWAARRMFLEKQRTLTRCTWSMLPVFSGVRDAHLLLSLWTNYFCYFMFFVVCVCFPSLPLDYILFVSAKILVSLITLKQYICRIQYNFNVCNKNI